MWDVKVFFELKPWGKAPWRRKYIKNKGKELTTESNQWLDRREKLLTKPTF
jgi:hypothetical protein